MPSKKKHQPPSKRKYAENHPSVTIHLTKEEYNDLWEMSFNNDKSMNQVLKEAAGLARRSWKKQKDFFDDGMDAGYENAMNDFNRNFRCSRCGRTLEMKPTLDDKMYKWLVEQSKEAGWLHSSCGK